MKLAVIGSRGFDNYAQLCQELDQMEGIECIISGGVIGADRMASRFAREHNIPLIEIYPTVQNLAAQRP